MGDPDMDLLAELEAALQEEDAVEPGDGEPEGAGCRGATCGGAAACPPAKRRRLATAGTGRQAQAQGEGEGSDPSGRQQGDSTHAAPLESGRDGLAGEPVPPEGHSPRAEQQPQQSNQHAAGSAEPGYLECLMPPLLLRVLAHLSPEDLLSASLACKLLNAAASDAALWRRLYHARWPDGPQSDEAEHVQGASWRVLYLERDAQAVLEARATAPSQELLPIYLQMATARRSEALSTADAERLFRSPSTTNRSTALATRVDAYRRQHNLTNARHHATHNCGAAGGCRWEQLDSTAWICAGSGFVHVCDANCGFRELDPSGEGCVCQVSGRCFAAEMLTEREEHAGEEERGRGRGEGAEQQEDDWAAEDGVSGRLGQAFVAGYNAQSAEAFFRRFGVRW